MHSDLGCDIDWDTQSLDEWRSHFNTIKQSTLLQSAAYLKAQRLHSKQKPRLGLIKINGTPAGIVGILEAELFWKAIHGVILDRGPLWFDGFGGAAHVKLFFGAFDTQFPKRFGRKRRVIPEIDDNPTARSLFQQTGLKRLERPGYETIRLDLNKNENELLSAMKKNWRGALNKAERADLTLEIDDGGQYLPWLLSVYAKDKHEKQYDGASPRLLQKIAQMMRHSKEALILRALENDAPSAAILIFCHGKSATYQIGWSGKQGRKANAHHFLLWRAINVLKERGIEDFDLGGINDETAKGVKQFKSGLGGETVRLVGHYI